MSSDTAGFHDGPTLLSALHQTCSIGHPPMIFETIAWTSPINLRVKHKTGSLRRIIYENKNYRPGIRFGL
jgi:hypothetical protein